MSAGEQIVYTNTVHCILSPVHLPPLPPPFLSKRGIRHRPGALYSVCTSRLLCKLGRVALHFSALFLLSEIVYVLLGIGEVLENKAPN